LERVDRGARGGDRAAAGVRTPRSRHDPVRALPQARLPFVQGREGDQEQLIFLRWRVARQAFFFDPRAFCSPPASCSISRACSRALPVTSSPPSMRASSSARSSIVSSERVVRVVLPSVSL